MNKENFTKYFSDLKEVYDKYGLDKYPSRVCNIDETGINFSYKPLKVLAKKGRKVVQGKSSISQETITVIACSNAAGNIIPQHFIIPGKTTKTLHDFDTEICREPNSSLFGAKFSVSDSGWTKDGINWPTLVSGNLSPEYRKRTSSVANM